MKDLSRALEDLDRAIAEATPAEAPALTVALSARIAALAGRSMNGHTPGAEYPDTQPTAPDGDLLTVTEAAEVLKVPPEWIYRRSQRLRFIVRLGARGLRVSRKKLEAWIRSREAGTH